jgi:hypothetical protein
MKTTKFTCLALLILTVLSARGEPLRTNINPALLYYQAFLMYSDNAKPLSDADWDYLGSKAGREQKLPERFGPILAGYDSEFKLVRAAGQQKAPCDWGIDMSSGPGTFLPHLRFIKTVAVASKPRVQWDLQHGNQTAARDDLLATFVLARNASRDGTVIGALVQHACEAIIYATVTGNFGQFSPETLKQLEAGFDAAPPLGTMATAIMTEKSNGFDWLVNKIRQLPPTNPENEASLLAAIQKDKELEAMENEVSDNNGDNPTTNFWSRALAASGGTRDGILKLVRETEPLYQRLTKIMALPPLEYEEQIQKFAPEIQQSQNPFVQLLFPDPLKPRVREFKIQAWQAMVRAAIEYKLHGEAGLKSVPDPFGKGPFACQRFVFEGVDRGFELKSAYAGLKYPCALIFVEKEGPSFHTDGPHIGEAVQP